MTRALPLPALFTPDAVVAEFAAHGIKISERELRHRARKLRACRQLGKAMFFTVGDVERIIAAAQPGEDEWQSSEKEAASGTTLSPSPESALEEARKLLTRQRPRNAHSPMKGGSVVPLVTAKKRN